MSWRRRLDGGWAHAPWWKVAINTALRWIQHGRPYALLVYTKSTRHGDPPLVLGYGIGWIPMLWDSPPSTPNATIDPQETR